LTSLCIERNPIFSAQWPLRMQQGAVYIYRAIGLPAPWWKMDVASLPDLSRCDTAVFVAL